MNTYTYTPKGCRCQVNSVLVEAVGSWDGPGRSGADLLVEPGILLSKARFQTVIDGENPAVDVVASGLRENGCHRRLDTIEKVGEAKKVSEELVDGGIFRSGADLLVEPGILLSKARFQTYVERM